MTNQRTQQFTLIAAIAGALALSACGKQETPAPAPPVTAPMAPAPAAPPPPMAPAPAKVEVTSVDLGSAIGADQKISTSLTEFGKMDTIYAAVSTSGSATTAALAAKWTYQDGQTVNESSQTIAPTGASVTTFHIAKPDGWPTGTYKVEIMLDGKSVSTKDFSVK